MLISVEETDKNQLEPHQRCTSVVTLFLAKNPWPKLPGVLEHCRKGETLPSWSLYGAFFNQVKHIQQMFISSFLLCLLIPLHVSVSRCHLQGITISLFISYSSLSIKHNNNHYLPTIINYSYCLRAKDWCAEDNSRFSRFPRRTTWTNRNAGFE
jgi:hypothetical protein